MGEEDGMKMYEHYMFFATWRFNIYKTEKQLMGNRNVVFETTQSLKNTSNVASSWMFNRTDIWVFPKIGVPLNLRF